jgi:hypothetical protein
MFPGSSTPKWKLAYGLSIASRDVSGAVEILRQAVPETRPTRTPGSPATMCGCEPK